MSPSSPESTISFSLRDAGVVLEQVADHQDAAARDGLLGDGGRLLRGLRERLLDEAVLAGAQRLDRETRVRGHVGREHDRVELGIRQQLVEVRRDARAGTGALRSASSGSASQHQRSSHPSSAAKLRARFGPQ